MKVEKLDGSRILIIDDDPVCRAVHRSVVEYCVPGAVILEAVDGIEGITKITSDQPDLILADLALPNLDGRRVIRELKATRELFSVPVLAISSVALSASDVHPLLPGVFHVPKPVARDDLEQMIVQCLTKSRVLPDFSLSQQNVERYAMFDLDAMEASLGQQRDTQLSVLSVFMENVGHRMILLDEIRAHKFSFKEARVAAHGMLGSARVVGASRLAYRLETLTQAIADDDQMLVTIYAKESKIELERVAKRVDAYLDLLSRSASMELINQFRNPLIKPDGPL